MKIQKHAGFAPANAQKKGKSVRHVAVFHIKLTSCR